MKTGTGRNISILCADKSIYHAQTHTFTFTPEFEEWETKDTEGPEQEFKKTAFSASVDGLVCVRESSDTAFAASTMDTPDVIASTLKGQAVDVIAKIALNGAPAKEYAVKCIIESFEVSEQVGAKATYKASLKGYNPKEMEVTPAVAKVASK